MGQGVSPAIQASISAIVRGAADRGLARLTAEDFRAEPGLGVAATVAGRRVHVGTAGWLARAGIDTEALDTAAEALASRGRTPALVAVDGALAGLIAVADRPADGAREVVAALRDLGITVTMVTGDRPGTARAVAAELGIAAVVAGVRPEEKARVVADERDRGRTVAMVGDGINDAPALAAAHVGIAVGTGTDIAIAAADVALLRGGIAGLPTALRLARRTLATIRQNLFWAFIYNVLGIPLAAGVLAPWTGWTLSPVLASAAMSLSSVSVLMNSLASLVREWPTPAQAQPGWRFRRQAIAAHAPHYVVLGLGATQYLSTLVWPNQPTQSPTIPSIPTITIPGFSDAMKTIADKGWFFVSDVASLLRAITYDVPYTTVIAVVLLPTTNPDRGRWHFFSYDRVSERVEHVSLRSSESGLFDLQDHGTHHVPAVLGAGRAVYGIPGVGTLDKLAAEVNGAAGTIETLTGRKPTYFRGATAVYDEDARRAIGALGYRIAGFSVNADAGATLPQPAIAAPKACEIAAFSLIAQRNSMPASAPSRSKSWWRRTDRNT